MTQTTPGPAPPANVRTRLQELGLDPRKSLGQHFLVSTGILKRILDAAQLRAGDLVLEVGPGLGILTHALVQQGAQVLAVELDRDLAAALAQDFRPLGDQVRIVHADAREVEPNDLLPPGIPYQVVANLPYYAATIIVRRLLESDRQPSSLVVMLQREVAQQMVAPPGRLGLLGIGVQFYGTPRILASVLPGAFYPPPKVTSSIVRIDVSPQPLLPKAEEESFFALVRGGFSAPRKQLRNSLSHALSMPPAEVERQLQQGGVDPRRRAESISLQEWLALHPLFRGEP